MLSFQRKSLSFESALSYLQAFTKKLTCVSLKEKQSVPTLQITVRSEWSVPSHSKCFLFRENHVLWKYLNLLKSISKKLTSVSLKEKQSVPTLQFTVRSELSVASLSMCCTVWEASLATIPTALLCSLRLVHPWARTATTFLSPLENPLRGNC